MFYQKILLFNPFVSNAPLLYPLKTSENLTLFWCFHGIEKGCIGNKWVKVKSSTIAKFLLYSVSDTERFRFIYHFCINASLEEVLKLAVERRWCGMNCFLQWLTIQSGLSWDDCRKFPSSLFSDTSPAGFELEFKLCLMNLCNNDKQHI